MKITVDETTREVPFSEITTWCICRDELFCKLISHDRIVGERFGWNAWSARGGLCWIAPDVPCQPVTVAECVCEEIPRPKETNRKARR